MQIAGIQFPESLCAALRDRRLVVFAGAGVSMGKPACLPDFRLLACRIAADTEHKIRTSEPVDRFLGRLQHHGIDVHARAAELLLKGRPLPTQLHRDLLRLCSDTERVRVVTTNFDLLFEQAAVSTYDPQPEVFRVPALPLGRAFNGIVHVHGVLDNPASMVLTDRDFGRAYLTEGWARRFLVELFRSFTVLFVGYSHDDTIMNYLARALPERELGKRFALTGELASDVQPWRLLGIEPIIFPQTRRNEYSSLREGVNRLVEIFSRGLLDWKREIIELANNKPPMHDGEESSLVDEAFRDVTKTRLFVEADTPVEWIGWLDKRNYLNALFFNGELSQRDQMLARWLSEHFMFRHTDELFRLIARHDTRLHPDLWWHLARNIESQRQHLLDREKLRRWVSLLLATVPAYSHKSLLVSMGKCCAKNGLVDSLLQIFDAVTGKRLKLKPSVESPHDGQDDQTPSVEVVSPLVGDNDELNNLWETISSLDLAHVAEPLLGIAVRRMELQHLTLRVWQHANSNWDRDSYRRSAIEPHEQDEFRNPISVVIDAARDCLEWLVVNRPGLAATWCDRFIGSAVPLLRRLAVHTFSLRADLVADKKLEWLMNSLGLHYVPAHHEIFKAVKLAYPEAGGDRRSAVIESVLAYRWPDKEDPRKEQKTAYVHFNWLHWLRSSDPNCGLANKALENVRSRYPKFQRREHPDLLSWSGPVWVGPQSPWTVEQLLAKPAEDWLRELLLFEPKDFLGPSRSGLVRTVQMAVEQNSDWGFDLADALAEVEEWDIDLWSGVIQAWSKIDLGEDNYRRVLNYLERVELYPGHALAVADVLYALVEGQGRPYAVKVLPEAHIIAVVLWDELDRDEPPEEQDSRIGISHAAGVLAEFWVGSLAIWRRSQESPAEVLVDKYSMALSKIVQDDSSAGKFGREIFGRYFHFLLAIDEGWTKKNMLPLFQEESDVVNFQAVWSGFLTFGRLNLAVAEHLSDAFLRAVRRVNKELAEWREQFVRRYTDMLVTFAKEPVAEWIPPLFCHGDREDWILFASHVTFRLREMDEARQRDLWNRWLKRYWKNRLQGVPVPLEPDEVGRMLRWLPHLTAVFPEAISLAICMLKLPIAPLERGYGLIKALTDNDSLIQDHSQEVAQLLIHLGRFDSRPLWYGGRNLIDKLIQSGLPQDLEQKLEGLKVTRGL